MGTATLVPASYEGAFFVYHGSASGISTTADAMAESNQANAQLGWSLSGAGDVNGDGYADVIVGAYNYDNGENDEGAAFVYHGSAAGLNTVARRNGRTRPGQRTTGPKRIGSGATSTVTVMPMSLWGPIFTIAVRTTKARLMFITVTAKGAR